MPGQEENLSFWMRDEASDDFLVFRNPQRIFYVTDDRSELLQALDILNSLHSVKDPDSERSHQSAVSGRYFAGAVAYDACKLLDPSLNAAATEPVLIGGLFDEPQRVSSAELLSVYEGPLWPVRSIRLERSRRALYDSIEAIRESIRAGSVYQANYTFPVLFSYDGDPAALFACLYKEQPAAFASALFYRRGDLNLALLSLSPELFFRVGDRYIQCRPMKGTAPRTGDSATDRRAVAYLKSSDKERAENAMIVDLIRNDLGQICEFGSVEVNDLFRVHELPTVFQMTTDVKGRLKDGLSQSDIFRSLFPCGSVTGAPKRAAIELLHALEGKGRGFYTGTLGWTNGASSRWNVAIRTAQIVNGEGSISIGSGITYDSNAKAEFRECLGKLAFFRRAVGLRSEDDSDLDLIDSPSDDRSGDRSGDFYLYETILFRAGSHGYWMLESHLRRLHRSARYFGLPCSMVRIRRQLKRLEYLLQRVASGNKPIRVHLRLLRSGRIKIILHELKDSKRNVTIEFCRAPALSVLPFLNHKTSTGRAFYERHKAGAADDCLFINERDEITETSIYTVFCFIDGRWITPPLRSGVLGGVMRERLLERGRIVEACITADDVRRASAIVLANSVRGLRRAVLIEKAD